MGFGWLAYIDEFGQVRYVVNDEVVLDDDYTLVEA